jgi:hypothetical protein
MQQCPPPVHQRIDPSGGQPRTPRTRRSACSQHEYGERIKMVAVADASSQPGSKGAASGRCSGRVTAAGYGGSRCCAAPRGCSFRTSPGLSVGGAWRNPGRSTVLRQRGPISLASVLLAGDRRTVGFTPPRARPSAARPGSHHSTQSASGPGAGNAATGISATPRRQWDHRRQRASPVGPIPRGAGYGVGPVDVGAGVPRPWR